MESAGMDAKTFPGVVCQGSPRDQAQHILDQLLCEGKTKECYQRTCHERKGKTEDLKDTIESTFLENGKSTVYWEEWKNTDRMRVLTSSLEPDAFADMFVHKLEEFGKHFYVVKEQEKAFRDLCKNLPLNTSLAVSDFA